MGWHNVIPKSPFNIRFATSPEDINGYISNSFPHKNNK